MRLSERDRNTLAEAKKTGVDIKRIDPLLEKGHSPSEIAEITDIPESRVEFLIEQYGLDWSE